MKRKKVQPTTNAAQLKLFVEEEQPPRLSQYGFNLGVTHHDFW